MVYSLTSNELENIWNEVAEELYRHLPGGLRNREKYVRIVAFRTEV
jgi:hypothetical protein